MTRRIIIALLILYGSRLRYHYALLTVYPIVSIAFHQTPSRFLTPVTTLIGFAFALLHASQRLSWERTLRLLGLVFGVSLLFESVGVATGLIYGP